MGDTWTWPCEALGVNAHALTQPWSFKVIGHVPMIFGCPGVKFGEHKMGEWVVQIHDV